MTRHGPCNYIQLYINQKRRFAKEHELHPVELKRLGSTLALERMKLVDGFPTSGIFKKPKTKR